MGSLLISNGLIIIYISVMIMKNFVFQNGLLVHESFVTFLPFGLSSVPYIFSKVMRQLLKHWRSKGYIVLFYHDDGIGGAYSLDQAKALSRIVRNDVTVSGFTLSEERYMSGGQFSWLHLEL